MAGPVRIPRDWKDLLELLRSEGVEFIIVGAYALAAHGHERYTKDLDIWVRADRETARKLRQVLAEFGFPEVAPTDEEWTGGRAVLQLGREPYRIDLLNFISGVEFDDALARRIPGDLLGVPVDCLDRQSLITNKLASARPQDLADVHALAPEQYAAAIRRIAADIKNEE